MGIIWVIGVFALYGIAFYIPLPPQFESRGVFITDEILLLVISILIYFTTREKHWKWTYVGLFLTLFAFALPLLRLWETAESTWNIILGLLPWADAEGYYIDANRLISGGLFSPFSGRRPLFASLLAVLLKLSDHNLQLVLVIFTAINGSAVFLLASEIQKEFGPIAATTTIYLSQLFYRSYVGTTLTEQLGFPVGLLACAILIRSVRLPNWLLFALGLMLLTFSLFVRAGAFFILPILFVYGIYFFVKRGGSIIRIGTVFTGALVLPFALNAWLGSAVASPTAVQFGNFADTLYGQAMGGKRWTQVLVDHPELNTLNEPARSQAVYQLAFKEIISNPLGIVKGSLKAWKDFVIPSDFSDFSFLEFGNRSVNLIFQTAVSLMFLTGIWMSWQARQDPISGFVLVSILGLFLSIPFLPPIDAGIRPYAATIAVIFLPVIVAVSRLSVNWVSDSLITDTQTSKVLASYGLCLIFTAVFGGFFLRVTAQSTIAQAVNCPSGFVSANIRVMTGSYVQLVESQSIKKTRIPAVLLKDVARSFDEFPYGDFAGVLRKIKRPVLITTTDDLSTGARLWVIAPPEIANFQERIISVCAESVSEQYSVIRIETFEIP